MLTSNWFTTLHQLAIGLVKSKDSELVHTKERNETAYQALVDSIGRHPTAENDPDVIDALLAVREALTRISESST